MSTIFKKLNFKDQSPIHVLDAPASFNLTLAELGGVDVRTDAVDGEPIRFALAFVQTHAQLDATSAKLAACAIGDAVLWLAYPKGSSRRYQCTFNRDSEWAVLSQAGFERVRMVAIDEDWSALRFRRVAHIASLKRHPSRAGTADGKRRTGASGD